MTSISSAVEELRTLRDVVRWGATEFGKAQLFFGHGFDNAWDEALFLARKVLHLAAEDEGKAADARLLNAEKREIAALYERRIQERKPAAYLTREAWFAGLPFYVDERVIIPRSPMAELVEQHFSPYLDHVQTPRILDLCTGSGCIAIACALAFPGAQVDAVDVSAEALAVAEKNVQQYGLADTIRLFQADLFEGLSEGNYDLIVSNPPYVDAQEMANLAPEFRHEPVLALGAGADGLDLVKRIIKTAPLYLARRGVLLVEVGHSESALMEQFPDLPFVWLEFSRGGQGVFLLTKEQLNY